MTTHDVAVRVLEGVGGKDNLVSNDLCMTRLRLTVIDPKKIDRDRLSTIPGVLGTVTRGAQGIEVIFGPGGVQTVYESLCELMGTRAEESFDLSKASRQGRGIKVRILGPNDRDDFKHRRQVDENASPAEAGSGRPVASALSSLLDLGKEGSEARGGTDGAAHREGQTPSAGQPAPADLEAPMPSPAPQSAGRATEGVEPPAGPRLLVINGPNINMLGIREPGIYGREDFAHLVALCRKTAQESGFSKCTCFQSNHEGDLVDVIQEAYGNYEGIVINPAAYTHTSVAILDALKSVSIPAVEVHISKVADREDFRQVSYVRAACFETVMGMGIRGYAKAIHDMANYLRGHEAED